MRLDDSEKKPTMTAAQMRSSRPRRACVGPGGLPPETAQGVRQQEAPGHQPDEQEEPEPGQGKGVDVRGLPPAQEAQDLLVDDVKACRNPGWPCSMADKPGQGEDQEHQPAPGVQDQGEQAGLAPEPGIARQDQQRERPGR